ncbi:MAG TPA: APC family permease [Sphingomonadaceae bacterium]
MNDHSSGSLRKDAVGTLHIVFFVIAAAAPLTAVVGGTPGAFAFGNGPGVPGAFIIAGVVYALFGAAFTAMSRHCGSAGGFYGYIARGLGKPASVAGAFVAVAAYSAIQVAIYALFGLVASQRLANVGLDLPWWPLALAAIVAAHLCGRKGIAFSGVVLGVLMAFEVLILLTLDIAILVRPDLPQGMSFASFSPRVVFGPGLGAALVFVVASYVGFEATTIFGEEAKNADRTIPRATYYAVAVITLLYAFSTWAMTLEHGPAHIQAAAAADTANLYFTAAQNRLGSGPRLAMEALLLTSLFASILAFHNTITRYLFALARDRLLPAWLGHVDAQSGAPDAAGKTQSACAVILVVVFGVAGFDAYTVVFSWLSAFATIGILVVQLLVAISAWRFFRTADRGVGAFRRIVAPLLSALGLATWLVLVCLNLDLLSGSQSRVIESFPFIILAVAVAGIVTAVRMKLRRPQDYARMGELLGQIA